MAKLADYRLNKVKQRMEAANSKPERPRINEQLGLEKTLLDLQKQSSEPERQIDKNMYESLSEKWKGNHGGSGGDAFVLGLTSGLQKGSFAEDKERNKKVMDFTEKMKNMVEEQNMQLFKEEKLYNARNSVTPRIMAYLDSYKSMSPNDRKVYLQNTLEEYNGSAGTNYKLIDSAGSEPWKIIISDGEEVRPLDLMGFIKTPEEKKLDYYYNSAENKQVERELQEEDYLNRQNLESQVKYNKARAEEKSPVGIQEKKQSLVESGEVPSGALLFDELPKHEAKAWIDDLRVERDKGKEAKNGVTALDEMDKIFKSHPKISTSLAKWANSKGDSPFDNFIKSIVNQEQRNALLELEKHAATLSLGTIQQFKGQRPTDILKKLIKETNPGSNFTPEAFEPIKNQLKNKFNEQISRSEEANRGLMKRYVPTYEGVVKFQNYKPSQEISALDQEEQALLKERELLLNGG